MDDGASGRDKHGALVVIETIRNVADRLTEFAVYSSVFCERFGDLQCGPDLHRRIFKVAVLSRKMKVEKLRSLDPPTLECQCKLDVINPSEEREIHTRARGWVAFLPTMPLLLCRSGVDSAESATCPAQMPIAYSLEEQRHQLGLVF